MSTLEELKDKWQQKESAAANPVFNQASLDKVVKRRVSKHIKSSFQYFWGSFILQLIVYALLGHVIVKYWQNMPVLYFAIPGILLYIPFTVMLLKKFKRLAIEKPLLQQDAEASVHDFVLRQQTLLKSFYHFKRWYEFFLIPLSCALGVTLVFELYVPGGVSEHWLGALITFLISLASCIAAIHAENKKSFTRPISELQELLDEFEQQD